jgi:hypothetical protein
MAKTNFSNNGYTIVKPIDVSDFNPVNILLATPEEIKKEGFLDENVSNDQIRSAIVYAQDAIIERVTGDCLMNQIKLLICSDAISQSNYLNYRRLLDEYLFPIVNYAVQHTMVPHLTLKIRNQGVVMHNDNEHVRYPGLMDVKYIQSELEHKMDFYVNRAVKFLYCNKDCFCELCGCYGACGCGVAPFQRQFSVSINLDRWPINRHPYE